MTVLDVADDLDSETAACRDDLVVEMVLVRYGAFRLEELAGCPALGHRPRRRTGRQGNKEMGPVRERFLDGPRTPIGTCRDILAHRCRSHHSTPHERLIAAP